MKTMTFVSGLMAMLVWAATATSAATPVPATDAAPTACEAQLSGVQASEDDECPHPCEVSRGSTNLCLCPS